MNKIKIIIIFNKNLKIKLNFGYLKRKDAKLGNLLKIAKSEN